MYYKNSAGSIYRYLKQQSYFLFVGGAVTAWLVHSTPERAVRVRALAGHIVLCSWARHYSHSASLHTGV